MSYDKHIYIQFTHFTHTLYTRYMHSINSTIAIVSVIVLVVMYTCASGLLCGSDAGYLHLVAHLDRAYII